MRGSLLQAILVILTLAPAPAGFAAQNTPPAATPAPPAAPPAAPTAPAPPTADPLAARILSLDHLRRDARDPTLPLAARRMAAEAMIAGVDTLAHDHRDEPRRTEWLADLAEDCFVTVLPLGGDLDEVLLGLPTHEEWQRVTAVVAQMRSAAADAMSAADATLARFTAAGGPPLTESERDLLQRLEEVEKPRRVPLLLGIAETLYALRVDADPADSKSHGAAALARLRPLAIELDGDTRLLCARYAALAAGCAGDAEALAELSSIAREFTPDESPSQRIDAELVIALAKARLGGAQAGVEAIRPITASLGADTPFTTRSRVAEAEARILRDGAPADPAWAAPLEKLIENAPRSHQASVREILLARLADVAGSEPAGFPDSPLLELALVEARSRQKETLAEAGEIASKVVKRPGLSAPLHAAALRAQGRVLTRQERYPEAVDAFLAMVEQHPADPTAPDAMERAIAIARALDDSAAGADPDARKRLRRSVSLGATSFPEHPSRPRWRVEDAVLAAEAALDDPEEAAGARDRLQGVQPALAALPDDEPSRALRARLAAANAARSLAAHRADDALRALAESPSPSLLAAPLANHILALRLVTLASLGRDPLTDPAILAARPAADPELARSAAAWLARSAPAPAPLQAPPTDPLQIAAVSRLGGFLASLVDATPPLPAESIRIAADAFRSIGRPAEALPLYERLLKTEPNRADLLLARAECIAAAELAEYHGPVSEHPPLSPSSAARLAEAMTLYRRLLSGHENEADPARRTPEWWLCQWREVEIAARGAKEPDRVAARIERLRALDPSLGGAIFKARFDSLNPAREASPAR